MSSTRVSASNIALERRFTLDGIHAPPIADDGHRYLQAQATTRAETNAQPFEQSELRGVAHRRAFG